MENVQPPGTDTSGLIEWFTLDWTAQENHIVAFHYLSIWKLDFLY